MGFRSAPIWAWPFSRLQARLGSCGYSNACEGRFGDSREHVLVVYAKTYLPSVMARILLVSLAILGLTGCSPAPLSYKRPVDQIYAAFGLQGLFGHYLCAQPIRQRGLTVVASIPDADCYRFDPPVRMKGTWFTDDEASIFFPNARSIPADPYAGATIWLDDHHVALPADAQGAGGRRAFALDFIGRKATYPGRYGHMGTSRSLVVVDRVISVNTLPPS